MVFWVLTSCFPEEARSSVLSPLSRVFLDRASQAQGADGPAHQQTGRLGHLAHPVPRCSLASLRPRLRLSLRDTQHSLLWHGPSPTGGPGTAAWPSLSWCRAQGRAGGGRRGSCTSAWTRQLPGRANRQALALPSLR